MEGADINRTDLVIKGEVKVEPNSAEVLIKEELTDSGFSCYYGEFTHVKEEDNLSFLDDDNSNQTVMVKEETVDGDSPDPKKCKLGETPRLETPTTFSLISWKRSLSEKNKFANSMDFQTAGHILMKQIFYNKRKNKKKKEDEIDHFFAAMKGSFRKFSELEQLQAKEQIFNIITNIEAKRCEQQYHMFMPMHPQNPFLLYSVKRDEFDPYLTSATKTTDSQPLFTPPS